MNAFAAYLTALLVACTASMGHAAPNPGQGFALASCQGRYTATLAESWLTGGMSDAIRLRRDLLGAMLEALTASDADPDALRKARLSDSIAARARTRALLAAARYGKDPRRKQLALSQLQREIRACDTLLLGARRSLQ